jgi:hypothetical protein
MDVQESAQYAAARSKLDALYVEIDSLRVEFRDLMDRMTAEIMAEQGSSS